MKRHGSAFHMPGVRAKRAKPYRQTTSELDGGRDLDLRPLQPAGHNAAQTCNACWGLGKDEQQEECATCGGSGFSIVLSSSAQSFSQLSDLPGHGVAAGCTTTPQFSGDPWLPSLPKRQKTKKRKVAMPASPHELAIADANCWSPWKHGDCLIELTGGRCDHVNHDWPRIDHAHMYRSKDRSAPIAIVGHVYDFDAETVLRWVAKAVELRLEFSVSGLSAYHENAMTVEFYDQLTGMAQTIAELS